MGYSDPEKQKQYQREWLARRREEWLRDNGPCAKCQSDIGLEIDHIDPATKDSRLRHPAGTSAIWSWSEERRNVELAKCQVLCFSCHKEKTAKEKASKVEHGGTTMYDKHGCRCDDCKAWKSQKNRRDKEKRKTKLPVW